MERIEEDDSQNIQFLSKWRENNIVKETLFKPKLMATATPQVKIYCGKESTEALQKRLKKMCLDVLKIYEHNVF